MDINKTVLIGRLTKDIDGNNFGYVGETAKLSCSIATNRKAKKNGEWIDEVSYIDIEVWGKPAENLKPYMTKGKQICVEGYLKQDRWESEGRKYSKLKVVADHVQLLGGNTNANAEQPAFKPKESVNSFSNAQSIEDDIPFDVF